MPLTTEELLIPRYKVIGDYPGSIFKMGQIISIGLNGGENIYCDPQGPKYSDYPNLFKVIDWCDYLFSTFGEDAINHFPTYIKPHNLSRWAQHKYRLDKNEVLKVKHWERNGVGIIAFAHTVDGKKLPYGSYLAFDPATKQEYIDYQNSLKK